ncbi:MAG: colanic acid biosynthesis glycosyltransferase WcaL [Comamonadaceae bacterium]|nr:colanic acid biosynthesis glycosyltransferase WcaL [Comamonadaceae bacterium]
MTAPVKLGYLIPQFPGQTHAFFWREISELERRGAEVVLFSTRKPPARLIAHDWSAKAMARTTYLGSIHPLQAIATLPYLPIAEMLREGRQFALDLVLSASASRQLVVHCRRLGIGHVHVHSCGRAALIAALAQRQGGPTYSLTLHGPLADYGPGQQFKWRAAKFATVVTKRLLEEVQATLSPDVPEYLAIQPMGVDTDFLKREAPYVPPKRGEAVRLFSCGRLNMTKGHQDLLVAVRLLRDQGLEVTLDIAGEDDMGGTGYRRELEMRISELALQDHVRLLGAIDANAVKEHLLAAHFFVLVSWQEAIGVAFMEAMSCEVPTLGTDVGGVAELITSGHDGILVQPKDPQALASNIVSLVDDPSHCIALGERGRARVMEAFHSGRGAETLLQEVSRT